jgi:predicted unusual protein kinase regulating ubiquinone biosynthesis (AarF/ABC1/UbiB family)
MLFVVRAVGILSGMSTNQDPNFDPWAATIPFAERLAQEELQRDWRGWLNEIVALGQLVLKLPNQLERVLTQAEQGNLMVKTSLAPDARKAIERVEQSVNRLTWIVLAVGLLMAGVNFYTGNNGGSFGVWLMVAALFVFLWGLFKAG